jgi:iron complex transport system ATP-binding protein
MAAPVADLHRTPPIVDVRVDRHYRLELDRPILEGVHVRIERGEHWALVGANGSGKSTLLAIVAGDLWPSEGVVRVLGKEYGRVDKRELRKRIGVVSSALFGNLPDSDTGLEVAASGIQATIGRLGPLDEQARLRGAKALAKVSASSTAPKPYGVLSQGERQRVMIARALVNEPRLLILDEPCNGLDPVARERFLDDLGLLAADPDGPTQIHVTHHLGGSVLRDSRLVLAEGCVASGLAEEVLTPECLSAAFGAPCHVAVDRMNGRRRFRLRVETS